MNPKHSRWSCRFARFLAVFSEERRGWLGRHAANCPECGHAQSAADVLERQLRTEAPRQRVAAPAGLDQRIMREIARGDLVAERRRTSSAWPFVTVGALSALAAVVVLRQTAVPPPAQNPTQPRAIAAATTTPPGPQSRGLPGLADLTGPVREILADDPLQTEARLVYDEARSAMRFLALNFLPASGPEAEHSGAGVIDG